MIFLTAKGMLADRVRGLAHGGGRLHGKTLWGSGAVGPHPQPAAQDQTEEDRDVLFYQDIQVNRKTREVSSGGRLVELTLKEFELLVYLLENQSRVVTRDELLNRIWGYEYDGETRTLTCTSAPFARSWEKRRCLH